MEDERPLLVVARDQPRGERRRELGGALVVEEASARVELPDPDELGDGVDEARTADTRRLDVSDDAQLDSLALDPDDLDGALAARTPHLICAASNAGPVLQQSSRSTSPVRSRSWCRRR